MIESESAEVEFYVNLFWEKHYRNHEGTCIICSGDGFFTPELDWAFKYCICPKGMELRKENERP